LKVHGFVGRIRFEKGKFKENPLNVTGTLILICGGDTESAWCLSNDAYPFSNYLAETQSILPLDSPVWALAEIPGESAIQIEKQCGTQGDPPLLVRQHMEPPRKFIFLTAQVCVCLDEKMKFSS
jgi:hypothetical protein